MKKFGVLQFKYNNDGIIYTINPSNIEQKNEAMGDVWLSEILPCGRSTRIPTPPSPWEFTEDLIYLIKTTPQDDDLVLRIIYGLSINEYDYDEDPLG